VRLRLVRHACRGAGGAGGAGREGGAWGAHACWRSANRRRRRQLQQCRLRPHLYVRPRPQSCRAGGLEAGRP
jgi:hypothetical protein